MDDDFSFLLAHVLYGELLDEISTGLSTKPSFLNGENAERFASTIRQYCERVWRSGANRLKRLVNAGTWLNTSRDLNLVTDFKDRVYVMDFFTYCCINCIHILPYLKQIEEEYAESKKVTVLGVHSPKFTTEKTLEGIKNAVVKNGITHPVLHDPETEAWRMYRIKCWPTVFIVGPGHTLLFILEGEVQIANLAFICREVMNFFELNHIEYDTSCLPILPLELPRPSVEPDRETGLLFPGSVTYLSTNTIRTEDYLGVSPNKNYLVVSDTGHNCIRVMSRLLNYKALETVGSGMQGHDDGDFHHATFNAPNGLVSYKGAVYVADTGNHSIRKIDFCEKTVTTVFRGEDYPTSDNNVKFLSPWDVCVGPKLGTDLSELNTLYIAVAGSHQIWALDLTSNPSMPEFCVPFAGSGKEENKSNLYRMKAGFAQPSGIDYSKLSPYYIYVADSESSTIKSIDLTNNGAVKTVVGGAKDPTNLFQFGDRDGRDGKHINVSLQHPMGIAVIGRDMLAVADTYNHKIKLIDTNERHCCKVPYSLELLEPNGICFIDNEDDYPNNESKKKLYVADTNHHQIVPIDIYESFLKDLVIEPGDLVASTLMNPDYESPVYTSDIMRCKLAYGAKIYCFFKWHFKENHKFNASASKNSFCIVGDAPLKAEYLLPNSPFNSFQPCLRLSSDGPALENKVRSRPSSLILGPNKLPFNDITIGVDVATCDTVLNVCHLRSFRYEAYVEYIEGGPKCAFWFINTHV